MSRIKDGDSSFKDCRDEIGFIFRLRDYLHLNYNKREDRLTFENQLLLAKQLQMEPAELMEKFYSASSAIHIKTRDVIGENATFIEKIKNKWKGSRISRLVGENPSWQRLSANRDILYDALISFHESGRLEEIIPSIKKIRFRTQYGAYHVYTVDMHSIFTVKRIVDLEETKRPKLVYNAYKKVQKKDLLLLAALLHDVGKGDPSGISHTYGGAEDAKSEAIRCGYSKDDAEKVAFLIGSHLIMPRIAFSRDIGDPHLIENFATSIESEELLNMLYVLTYADIASIGPDVWNEWKERLLAQLYTAAVKWLNGIGPLHMKAEVERLKSEIKKGYSSDHVEHWLNIMPDRYFGNYDTKSITSHIQMFEEYSVAKPAVLVKHDQFATHSEFLVMTRDAPGLFSKVAGVIASHRINILDAELHTAKDGLVFDILRVQNEVGKPTSQNIAFDVIYNIESVLSGRKDVSQLLMSRHSIFKRDTINVETKVFIDNDVSAYYTVVDVQAKDRLGLLYHLSRAFFEETCSIWLAKILTKAETAIDTFYITDLAGNKITNKQKLDNIKGKILEVI
jgi:[protein-PII] uridylyltransferase